MVSDWARLPNANSRITCVLSYCGLNFTVVTADEK